MLQRSLNAILILWAISSGFLMGQSAPSALLYRITAVEHLQLLTAENPEINFLLDRTPVAEADRPELDTTLAPGHYLSVRASGEHLQWEAYSKHLHQIYLHDDDKQLHVGILDQYGQEVADAELEFENRTMHFSPDQGLYRSRRIKPGLLKIYLPGDTLFYEIDTEEKRSVVWRRVGYFSNSRVGRVVTFPLLLLRGPVGYLKRGIGRGHWRIYNWPFERLYQRIRQRHFTDKNFAGFLASQQPLYRPGDTLKLAASLAYQRGRPYRRPLRLHIHAQRKTWVDTIVQPSNNGQLQYQWVLADSLPLDTRYQVTLSEPSWRRSRSLTYYFKLEDYELDEYQFRILNKRAVFAGEDPVEFDFTVKDANQLPIPTAEVEAYFLTERFSAIYQDPVAVPDTLWHYRSEVGDRTDFTLSPPDSIWPMAGTVVRLVAFLRGPSGELLSDGHVFRVERKPQQATLTLTTDSLLASVSGSAVLSTPLSGVLTAYAEGDILQRQLVPSGARIKLNPGATRYHWKVRPALETSLSLSQYPALVQFNYRWQQDTLYLQWQNPRQLPLHWTLHSSRRKLQEQFDTAALVQIQLPLAQSYRQCWLSYTYYWAGREHQQGVDLKALRSQLRVDLDIPDRIYPGQTTNLAIRVSDDQGRPVGAAPVIGGAYNAQMQQGTPYELTDIRFKGRRPSFHRQSYYQERAEVYGKNSLNTSWYRTLALDSLLYYQLRSPGSSPFTHYRPLQSEDSLAQVTAQLAPWLVQDFRAQPIHLIYLDNRLVYYADSWQDTPFSIVAEPGYHQVVLRGTGVEVRIDSVHLQAGQQLVLSVDLNQVRHKQVQIVKRSTELSSLEITRLERQLFYLGPRTSKQSPQYLYQDPRQIFLLANQTRGVQALGLFQAGRKITQLQPREDTVQFSFEPYYYYEIGKGRDRLYAHRPLSQSSTPIQLSAFRKLPRLGQEAIFPSDIKAPVRHWRYSFDEPPSEPAKGRGRLQLFTQQLPQGTRGLILSESDTIRYILPPQPGILAVPQGTYTLSWFGEDSTLWEIPVSIPADGLYALRVDSSMLTPKPLPPVWRAKLITKRYPTPHRGGPTPPRGGPRTPARDYTGIGQLLSGYITDDGGEPLIGATILVKGTSMGTVTDLDGYYELWAPPGVAEIIVSYTGFETKEVSVGYSNNVDLVLTEGVHLDEVVVIGYGVRVQKDNTTTVQLQGQLTGAQLTTERPSRRQSLALTNDLTALPLDSIRTDFRDNAYWQPLLATDNNGVARFQVQFPDDITNWRHFALVRDRKARLGLAEAYTRSYLPLQAQLYTPRFLLEGDRSEVIGLLNNRTGQPQALQIFFQDELSKRREEEVTVEDALRLMHPIDKVPSQDSLQIRFGLQQGDYRDGEERSLPVFRRGIERTVGQFKVLRDEQTLPIEADPGRGPVQLTIGGNMLPQLREAIQRLRKYPHHCNEQTASRLIALLANERLGQLEEESDDLSREIRQTIRKLSKNRHPDGRWGWWPQSQTSESWITRHVLAALDMAKAQGYLIPDVEEVVRDLISELPSLPNHQLWSNLLFLAERGQALDYTPYLIELDTLPRDLELEMTYQSLRYQTGEPFDLSVISQQLRRTLTGAAYWGEQDFWYYAPFRQSTRLSLQGLQLYQAAGDSNVVASIQQHFLEPSFGQPMSMYYPIGMNTYEASKIVKLLLPMLTTESGQLEQLRVFLQHQSESQVIEAFPQQRTLFPQDAPFTRVRKTGSGPAFVSYHQTYWEEEPAVENNGFSVRTEAWQHGQKTRRWSSGSAAELSCTLKLEADAEYVKIEIPVPGGCSYGPKSFNEIPWETHREYRRDRVVIYCEQLPAGEYQLSVPLEPRFRGDYQINPAQAEMMYIPGINGVGNTLQIEIE